MKRWFAGWFEPHKSRLIGKGFPGIKPSKVPPEIIAAPRVSCPKCQGAVMPELRQITGGLCYQCHLNTLGKSSGPSDTTTSLSALIAAKKASMRSSKAMMGKSPAPAEPPTA